MAPAAKKNTLPMAGIEIRDITAQDFPSLRALYDMSLRYNSSGFIQDKAEKPLKDIAQISADFQTKNSGAMIGLYEDDVLIGFGGLCGCKSQERVELCKLHLDPKHQGKGLGRTMVEYLIKRAKQLGYSTVELHVTATQVAALGLYVRLGFKQTKREVYLSPENESFDTIFMERPIDMAVE